TIQEENNYYPFGLKHAGYGNTISSTNGALKYKFNKREYQDELGLNVTAMDWRQYDPAIGRFNVIDPLAEKKYDNTPYRFGFNNPVFWSDPTGLFETRKEAREYRRANGVEGRIQRNGDGGYDINNYKTHTSYSSGDDKGFGNDSHSNDGVVESALVTKSKSSFGGKDLFDVAGTDLAYAENIAWKGMSTASKSKFAWDNADKLARIGLKGSTSVLYKTKIPTAMKGVGVGMGLVSAGLVVSDVVINEQIKASNVLDGVITGASFIPGWGWVIGGAYLGADSITKGVSGKSIGQHLDEAVEEKYDLDNGTLTSWK
ncbi:RHS repeat-associated core domain-containing protein, partial [Flavobacterium omnivorum]